jgi:phage terminase large subunit GpA-like protein
LCLVAGIDVQHDRFAIELLGIGLDDETWSLDYTEIPADTSLVSQFEDRLDPLLATKFLHETGLEFRIVACCIDSGDGARTQQVYEYCEKRLINGVYAIKGRAGKEIPLAGSPSKQKIGETGRTISMYTVGTDTAKHEIFAHLAVAEQGPGYMHFPHHYKHGYFDMLTAERAVRRKEKGRGVLKFEMRPGHVRNEALDCRVYAMAAFEISGANLQTCQQLINDAVNATKSDQTKKQPKKRGVRMISKGVQ